MKIIPYLNFDGKAEAALHFYAKALGGKESEIMRFGTDSMPGIKEHMKDWVLHAELQLKECYFYLSDTFEPEKLSYGTGYTVHIDCDSEEEIHALFNAMKENGEVTAPLEDTFWGAVYGSLTDQFGIQWSFNFQKNPDMT